MKDWDNASTRDKWDIPFNCGWDGGVYEGKLLGIKEVVEWIDKNKKWEEEHYSGRSTGTPQSTGGIIYLTDTYYLISKDKLQDQLKVWGFNERE